MTIIFQDLESILMDWKRELKMEKPSNRTGKFVYNRMKETIDNRNRNRIDFLFKNISHDDIQVRKTIESDSTIPKKEVHVYINKNNSSL